MPRGTAIGLDIGTSVVRAAELSFRSSGATLDRIGQVVLPEDAVRDGELINEAEVVEALQHLWAAAGFRHKHVTLGVANQRVVVRHIEIPWMERSELRTGLAFHIADILPFAVEDAVHDFLPLGEVTEGNDRKLRGLLVAASRETVLATVRCAERAGLRVKGVDLTPFALLRSLGSQTDLAVGTEALIDIGAKVTNIVVHSAASPKFVRILVMGGQDITDVIAEDLGIDLGSAEAMKQQFGSLGGGSAELAQAVTRGTNDFVDEIRGSLDYYAAAGGGGAIERIVLSGGGSQLSGLIEQLSTTLRTPVVAGDPLARLSLGRIGLDREQLEIMKPLSTVAVGLALGAA